MCVNAEGFGERDIHRRMSVILYLKNAAYHVHTHLLSSFRDSKRDTCHNDDSRHPVITSDVVSTG